MSSYTPQSAFFMGVLIGTLLPIIGYGLYRLVNFLLANYADNIREEVEKEYAEKEQQQSPASYYAPVEPVSYKPTLYWYGAKDRSCPSGYTAVMDSDSPDFYFYVGYSVSLSEQIKRRYDLISLN